ncbi:MAG: hypothetical protein Q9169_008375, partial [Polycauliona sp. 2 TL-2023]
QSITTVEEEKRFTETMAELVETHKDTIPTLARGLLECRRYIGGGDVTRFLDEHLRARIGTRLIAEQHVALHVSSRGFGSGSGSGSTGGDGDGGGGEAGKGHDQDNYIGVIDTALRPAEIIRHCEAFVGEICELKYGVRPTLVINGNVDATMTHVPTHLEYIITELLKNAFRATVESGKEREPVEVTIAAPPPSPTLLDGSDQASGVTAGPMGGGIATSTIPGVTIRIRDRGGGISPDVLPNIWAYSFTTFADEDVMDCGNGNADALNAISGAGGDSSSLAGLGYGLPLGRAYAEHFGGGVQLQSLWGWGTDVYLKLKGLESLLLQIKPPLAPKEPSRKKMETARPMTGNEEEGIPLQEMGPQAMVTAQMVETEGEEASAEDSKDLDLPSFCFMPMLINPIERTRDEIWRAGLTRFLRSAARGEIVWDVLDPPPCAPRHPSDVPAHARQRSALARENTEARRRESREKADRPRRASLMRRVLEKLPGVNFGRVIRESASHGHGVHDAAKTFEEARSGPNTRRNSVADIAADEDSLAVVEEEVAEEPEQPEAKEVKMAESTGPVAPMAAAPVAPVAVATPGNGKDDKDGDSGYVSQRVSGLEEEQKSSPARTQ